MSADFLETSIRYYCLKSSKGRGAAGAAVAAVAAPAVASVRGENRYLISQAELLELARRRFFYRPAFEIYGGVAGFFTYGPPGCAVKNSIIKQWRQHFVIEENLLEVEDTCIMQHAVLKASGHVDRFNDFMVKDVLDESRFFRADKLLEEVMDEKLKAADITEAQRLEYTSVRNQADAYSQKELAAIFKTYMIKAPESGNDLSDPYAFNLMFPTPIGPGGYLQGYLRPETAQGIFLNYKFCIEQNSNRLPFGVAQVGRAFRNEIAPRAGLTRQREFTQAEIEYFVNPKNKLHPKFKHVEAIELTLFHADNQLAAKDPIRMQVGEAVRNGVMNNETLGFFVARTFLFLKSIGIRQEHIRFRQHLPTEMAHYACDCWDAEIYCSHGWLECVGIADRAAFDLNAHATAAKCDLQYKETLEKAVEREVLVLTKQGSIKVMKAFSKDGKMVKEHLESLSQEALTELVANVQQGTVNLEVDGKTFSITKELLETERKIEKQTVNAFTPGVIEPSFGIDRIFTSLLEHVYYTRPKELDSEDKQIRGVLGFAACIAPYKIAILPLDQRIGRHEVYAALLQDFCTTLGSLGLPYMIDDSGATIGKRYARNDELGIPFAATFDFDTLEDKAVTLRERDSMEQIRLPLQGLGDIINDLCRGETSWSNVKAQIQR